MKEVLLYRRILVIILIAIIGIVLVIELAIAQQSPNGREYVFGFNRRDNSWGVWEFLPGGRIGNNVNSGSWRKAYHTMFPFMVEGKTYLLGFNESTKSWFIRELFPDGKLGNETDSGRWQNTYHSLSTFTVAGKTYLLGFNESTKSWFIRELFPDGKLGNETDSGRWQNTYHSLSTFTVAGKTYLLGFSETKDFWFIRELLPGGKLGNETDSGRWQNTYHSLSTFTVAGKTYLLGFSETKNFWFIRELLPGGKLGNETHSGRSDRSYQTLTVLTALEGNPYMFALESSNNSWFIQQLLPGGRFGKETDTGFWDTFYHSVQLYSFQKPLQLDCENAIVLADAVPYRGTTEGASSNADTYNCRDWDESGPEVVHTITTSTSGDLTATLKNLAADLDVVILDACDVDRCIAQGGDSATYSNAPPGTYYIVVEGYKGARGSYTLTANIPTPVTSTLKPISTDLQWIQSPGGGTWGDWGQETHCPENMYAYAFRLRIERPQNKGDNTALTDIELRCREVGSTATGEAIYSAYYEAGDWSDWESCDADEFLASYAIRVQSPQGRRGDNTSANDVIFGCRQYDSEKVEVDRYLSTSYGGAWGRWSHTSFCPPLTAICGLKTRVAADQGDRDDTGVNDVMFSCCPTRDEAPAAAKVSEPLIFKEVEGPAQIFFGPIYIYSVFVEGSFAKVAWSPTGGRILEDWWEGRRYFCKVQWYETKPDDPAKLKIWGEEKGTGKIKAEHLYVSVQSTSRANYRSLRSAGGKCLDVHVHDLEKDGGRVQIWECNNTPQQQWQHDGQGRLVSAGGKCLDVYAPDLRKDGGNVRIWECNNTPQQQWRFDDQGRLVSAGGKCLDVYTPDLRKDGGKVQIWKCTNTAQQQWRFE